jgi:Cu-Zn family superoxide dismutase
MHPVRTAAILLALLTLGGATMAIADQGKGRHDGKGKHWRSASATLMNAEGDRIGRVWFKQSRDSVSVIAHVGDVPPGFHGFHIHAVGRCEPPSFTSAGGHLNPEDSDHGDHAGDLPSLLVQEDGTAYLMTVTDRFSVDDLRDADGSAVMVHSGRDNFANIPDRYVGPEGPGPDAESLGTGDAGSRLACGEVR